MTGAFWQGRVHIMAILVAGPMLVSCASVNRYTDVIYLADRKQPPLQLKVLYRTPLLASRDSGSTLAYLSEGQTVEVVGLGETQDYVKAQLAGGRLAQGWVSAGALEAPPSEILAELRGRRTKAESHRDLIEQHEVVTGMTSAEVRTSLGRPDRISRVQGRLGIEEQWRYIRYNYEPHYVREYDANGQLRQVVSYQRKQAGERVITIRKDEVVEIADDAEGQSPEPLSPANSAVP